MNRWDITSGIGHLQRAAQKLHDRWEASGEHWNDAARREFATEHLDPLLPQLKSTLAAIERLNEILESGRREVIDIDELPS